MVAKTFLPSFVLILIIMRLSLGNESVLLTSQICRRKKKKKIFSSLLSETLIFTLDLFTKINKDKDKE